MSTDAREQEQERKLAASLARLDSYTERGRMLAESSVSILENAATDAAARIMQAQSTNDATEYGDDDVRWHLERQLNEIRHDFELLPYEIRSSLQELPRGPFSIILFGRTEVGKTTLANVLTKGQATRVGRGGQRTTRNVHEYTYRGLHVTDVPGLNAIEGAEDEAKALEAARKGDLILFLITNNGIQDSEAAFLAKAKALGKPLICMVNVKATCRADPEDEEDMEDAFDNIEDEFDDVGMYEEIRNGVLGYAEKYGQNWNQIPFCYVHLESALLAMDEAYAAWSERLREASRIERAMDQIIDMVRGKGCYMRLKSYVDVASKPLGDIIYRLSTQCADNTARARVISEKLTEYDTRVTDFQETRMRRVNAFLDRVDGELRDEASTFAENHFDDRNADRKWRKAVATKKYEQRAQDLLDRFSRDASRILRSFDRELNFALSTLDVSYTAAPIMGKPLANTQRTIGRAAAVLAAGIGVAGLFSQSPLLLPASIAIGIVTFASSHLLKGYDEERKERVEEFRGQLNEFIDSYVAGLRAGLEDGLLNKIIGEQLNMVSGATREVEGALVELSDYQLMLGSSVEIQMVTLSGQLVREALGYRGHLEYAGRIRNIARKVGVVTALCLNEGSVMPTEVVTSIQGLLGEETDLVACDANGRIPLGALLTGCSYLDIRIERTTAGAAFAPAKGRDKATPNEIRAVYLCAQLANVIIVDEGGFPWLQLGSQRLLG